MKWKKLGQIFAGHMEDPHLGILTHGMIPTPHAVSDSEYDIYFAPRDYLLRGHIYRLRYNIDLMKITQTPSFAMSFGKLGTFDDSGCIPASIVKVGDRTLFYYTGVNLRKSVPFANNTGLGEILPDGTVQRLYEGPVIDRSPLEPHFCASTLVLYEDGIYKAWYGSGVRWEQLPSGDVKHFYHIKYAESTDGVHWQQNATVAIDFKNEYEYAITRASILKDDALQKMWYCYRASSQADAYRIGYAESADGHKWERKDHLAGIDVSESGWDSEMMCYPSVFRHKDKTYMLYNGNGYGKTGFGLAVLEKRRTRNGS